MPLEPARPSGHLQAMNPWNILAVAFSATCLLAVGGCTAVPPATPQPAPTPAPTSAPRPAPAPAPTNWMDAPRTPGDWSYAGTTAKYAAPNGQTLFSMTCDRPRGAVSLVRSGGSGSPAPMRIMTETATRLLDARPAGTQSADLAATLSARDSLLDAIALSRGRFAVEAAGLPTLYLPSWAEVSRVIEDCR